MQIIHFKKLCVPVYTGASKGDKSLKMPSGSISESVIFKISCGGMLPDPPSVGAPHTMTVHIPAIPTST